MNQKPDKLKESTELKKGLSLTLLIFYGVGTILGLGIYVLIGKISGEAGMLAPFAFLVAAIIAGFTGLSYGELAARFPKSGGEVNYVQEAFDRKFWSTLVGWLIVLSAVVSTSTVVNGYVGYVQVFLEVPDWVVITGITVILGAVAIWGIKESAVLITIITLIEVAGILYVIFLGADSLGELSTRWTEVVPDFTATDWQAISLGAFLAFFAFIGFEDMVNVSEEAKNPRKDMPVAILISMIILTVLYILVALIASLTLTPEQLNASDAPLADIVALKGEVNAQVIGLISLVAIVNGVLVQIIMCARVMYGMAEMKMAPSVFGIISKKTRTPVWGTIITVGFVLLLALNFDLESLAKAANYILLTVFTLVNVALIVIKNRTPKVAGVRTISKWIPYAGAVFSFIVMLIQILSATGVI